MLLLLYSFFNAAPLEAPRRSFFELLLLLLSFLLFSLLLLVLFLFLFSRSNLASRDWMRLLSSFVLFLASAVINPFKTVGSTLPSFCRVSTILLAALSMLCLVVAFLILNG